jgi:hypothetical protein
MNREWLFGTILRIYPAAFRKQFGDELRALHDDSTSLTWSERWRFLADLFLGAVYERLRASSWVRFAAAGAWMIAIGVNLIYAFWNELPMGQLFPVFDTLNNVSDLRFIFLPFALISRLPRAPTTLEWLPLGVLVPTMLFVLALLPWRETAWVTQLQFFIGNFVTPAALGCYGIAGLRSSSAWLRTLKLAVLGVALLMLTTSWFDPMQLIFGIEKFRLWGAARAVCALGVVLGLLLEAKPRPLLSTK